MTKEKMMIEQNKANVTKYGAAFLKEGEGLSLWYRGGRITVFDNRFVLSILGLNRIAVFYKEILKIEKERYCLHNCITVYCVNYRVYIQVSASNRDELFNELQNRKSNIGER